MVIIYKVAFTYVVGKEISFSIERYLRYRSSGNIDVNMDGPSVRAQ